MDWCDDRFEYDSVVDPFMDVDYDLPKQTGSDWYNLALSASFGGKALHGFGYAATSETLAKTTFEFSEKHATGWIRTNEMEQAVEPPGDEWDEHLWAASLHTGVHTGSQLSLMFDTGYWEPSTATRARNAAYLAAGMVAHGTRLERATKIASTIAADIVSEDAVMNTLVPLSHLKREAAGGAKASHAIYSRANAQRKIRWDDAALHHKVLPPNAAMDWARLTVLARYIGEANYRYDPDFRMLAKLRGIPYVIIKGAWAYVSDSDYLVDNRKWDAIVEPETKSITKGYLATAYTGHASDLVNQIMRTYNELATGGRDANLESLLRLVESVRPKRSSKKITISTGTDVLMETVSHQQSAASAAEATSRSATTYNAITQAVSEFVRPDRGLMQAASKVVTCRGEFEQVYVHLSQFYPIFLSKHTWIRAFEVLDNQLKNPTATLTRLNRLHRSMTGSSATLEVDVPVTVRSKRSAAPHIVAILKKVVISTAPEVKLPRYVTDLRAAISRGHQAQLLDSLSTHFHDYRLAWSKRYEDWSHAYALAGGHHEDSVLYGCVSIAFKHINVDTLLSPTSGFIDGANPRQSYLYHMAADYARKRRLKKPVLPTAPIASAEEYASMLDNQYSALVKFTDCEAFARARIEMFAADLALDIVPRTPLDDEPDPEELKNADNTYQSDEDDFDMDALDALIGGGGVQITASKEQVEQSYTGDLTAEQAALANGYASFDDAYAALGEGARFDPETTYTQQALAAVPTPEHDVAGGGIAIE